jgi:hypothetical protein
VVTKLEKRKVFFVAGTERKPTSKDHTAAAAGKQTNTPSELEESETDHNGVPKKVREKAGVTRYTK